MSLKAQDIEVMMRHNKGKEYEVQSMEDYITEIKSLLNELKEQIKTMDNQRRALA